MNILFSIFAYSWLITILFSISIIISFPLLKDYYDQKYELFIPVYNLFKLSYVICYSELLGLLYLVPIINILFIIFTGIRLKDKIETYSFLKIGFIIFPFIFIPLSAYIKYVKVPKKSKKVKKQLENDIEYFEKNKSNVVYDEFPQINLDDESIFKLRSQIKKDENQSNKPYKAKKVIVNENFINSAPAELEIIKKAKAKDDTN